MKVLVLEEDDLINPGTATPFLKGSTKPLWLAHYAVLVKKDGTTEVLKDRWGYPGNKKVVDISLPY
jgi:hypothetical protein